MFWSLCTTLKNDWQLRLVNAKARAVGLSVLVIERCLREHRGPPVHEAEPQPAKILPCRFGTVSRLDGGHDLAEGKGKGSPPKLKKTIEANDHTKDERKGKQEKMQSVLEKRRKSLAKPLAMTGDATAAVNPHGLFGDRLVAALTLHTRVTVRSA